MERLSSAGTSGDDPLCVFDIHCTAYCWRTGRGRQTAARPRMPTVLPTAQAGLVRVTPSRDGHGAGGGRGLEARRGRRGRCLGIHAGAGPDGSVAAMTWLGPGGGLPLVALVGWEHCLPRQPELTDYTDARTDRRRASEEVPTV